MAKFHYAIQVADLVADLVSDLSQLSRHVEIARTSSQPVMAIFHYAIFLVADLLAS